MHSNPYFILTHFFDSIDYSPDLPRVPFYYLNVNEPYLSVWNTNKIRRHGKGRHDSCISTPGIGGIDHSLAFPSLPSHGFLSPYLSIWHLAPSFAFIITGSRLWEPRSVDSGPWIWEGNANQTVCWPLRLTETPVMGSTGVWYLHFSKSLGRGLNGCAE